MSCIDELTVNLTELFRNNDIWQTLKEEVKERYGKSTSLKYWHAGCSTGEEVYSMLYIIQSLSFLYKVKVLATDLSTIALDQAKEGKYSSIIYPKYKRNFEQSFPGEDIENIITVEEDKSFSIKPRLKENVEFKIHNLVSDSYPSAMDIIFCRNVMIYFDDSLKMAVLKKFYDALKEEGILVIGFYDLLPKEASMYFEVYNAKAKIYKKIKR